MKQTCLTLNASYAMLFLGGRGGAFFVMVEVLIAVFSGIVNTDFNNTHIQTQLKLLFTQYSL